MAEMERGELMTFRFGKKSIMISRDEFALKPTFFKWASDKNNEYWQEYCGCVRYFSFSWLWFEIEISY
jgi:hypothetical protein